MNILSMEQVSMNQPNGKIGMPDFSRINQEKLVSLDDILKKIPDECKALKEGMRSNSEYMKSNGIQFEKYEFNISPKDAVIILDKVKPTDAISKKLIAEAKYSKIAGEAADRIGSALEKKFLDQGFTIDKFESPNMGIYYTLQKDGKSFAVIQDPYEGSFEMGAGKASRYRSTIGATFETISQNDLDFLKGIFTSVAGNDAIPEQAGSPLTLRFTTRK